MPDITLATEKRTERGSRPAGRRRRQGKVPAVVYGLGTESMAVTVPARELQHILAGESGVNSLITLQLDGESILTLPRQIHRHPTRGELVHVDFVRIRRDVAVSAEIPVHLVGEATGAKDGGLVEQVMFHLAVEAMPGDIPVAIEVDVTELAIGDQLHLSDITLPARVATQADPETVVVLVAPPRVAVAEEGEEAAAAEAAEGEAPGAEAAEGEAASGDTDAE
jgi:large subunit ribosomal protein L25